MLIQEIGVGGGALLNNLAKNLVYLTGGLNKNGAFPAGAEAKAPLNYCMWK